MYIGNLNHSIFPLLRSTSPIHYYLRFNYLDIVSGVKKIVPQKIYQNLCLNSTFILLWKRRRVGHSFGIGGPANAWSPLSVSALKDITAWGRRGVCWHLRGHRGLVWQQCGLQRSQSGRISYQWYLRKILLDDMKMAWGNIKIRSRIHFHVSY